jgi:hypothetical protein
MKDNTSDFLKNIDHYYKPFDTVGALNASIKSKSLKNIVNLCLFVGGSIFFLFSVLTLYKLYTTGYRVLMDTRVYLFVMLLMLTTDVVAVISEGKDIIEHIKEKTHINYSSLISISISFIIGAVTAYMIYNSWTDYRAGIKKIAPDLIIITIMKMILAAVITYKSGQVLWEHLVKPTAEITKITTKQWLAGPQNQSEGLVKII